MVVRVALVVSVVALGLARGGAGEPGCGGGDSPLSGANGPCTRNKDCGGSLECREGVCTMPDAGLAPDASTEDASDDGG